MKGEQGLEEREGKRKGNNGKRREGKEREGKISPPHSFLSNIEEYKTHLD